MGLRYVAIRRYRFSVILLALMLSLFAAGCKKKTPPPAPPPPPPPAKTVEAPKPDRPVVASFEAEPSTIERGQGATLRWRVTGESTDVSIAPGIGTVAKEGSRQVFPGNTTTYTLTVTGPGGSATRTASVNVTSPMPATTTPPVTKPTRSPLDIISQDLKDALFDYDSSNIREDARAILARNGDVLKALFADHQNVIVTVEGHADERGSAEYNLGLADRRSTTVKEFLVQLGVPANRLNTVSFGKERPQCTDSNESCWQMNRRAHFSAGQ